MGSIPRFAILLCVFQTNSITAKAEKSEAAKTPTAVTNPADSRDASKADSWFSPDIDQVIPPVEPGIACPLAEVLSGAGERVEEFVHNVDKFTAKEVVEHQNVDHSGRLGVPEIRKFNYLVTIAQGPGGYMNVEEYRNRGSTPAQFPDHIATLGTPAFALVFHPHYVNDFEMECEGLGQWQGQPAWQVRFEERPNRRNSMMVVQIGGSSFSPRLRGRAWILADSYQVARLVGDLAEEIPKIRLRLQHQEIKYRPVPLPEGKGAIWLPSSTELYMDFIGRRFYRQHIFTDFQFFSVKVRQTFGDPKQ